MRGSPAHCYDPSPVRMFLFAIVLASPVHALAQADDAYQVRIREAVAEFDGHRFAEARALFRQAHEIAPNARTLRGIGLASFEMGDYVEAHRALEAALSDPRRPLTPRQREVAEGVLERARRFVGVYPLDITPRGALVSVDGGPAEPVADGPLILALGAHTVEARFGERTPARVAVVVRGGEEETLNLRLAPSAAAARPAAHLALPDAEPPALTVEETSTSPDLTFGIVALAAGGAIAGSALAAGTGWWLGREEEITRCAEAGAECYNMDELRRARDAAAGTTFALGVLGAAGIVLGAVLLATLEDDDPTSVACAPFGAGVACAGRF